MKLFKDVTEFTEQDIKETRIAQIITIIFLLITAVLMMTMLYFLMNKIV